jgi:hypothetical protein
MKPQIRRVPFGREIDPASLELGLTPAGPVLAVTERYTRKPSTYGWRDGELRRVRDLAVFPLEKPALSVRRDGSEVMLALVDSECKAPPYLRFVGKRLLALTCDGVLASYFLEGTGLRRDWRTELAGVLVPIAGASPIQLGNLDGAGDPELILGPVRHGSKETPTDQVEIRDLESGRPVGSLLPILSLRAIRSAPAVINLDDDCCDEVVTLTDQPEVWDPNAGVKACRCPSPD